MRSAWACALRLRESVIPLGPGFEHLREREHARTDQRQGDEHCGGDSAPMAADESGGTVADGVGPRLNRLVRQEAPQVAGKVSDALVAISRVFFERLGEDVVEVSERTAAA